MKWIDHVECKGGFRNGYKILIVKEREPPFRKSRQTCENKIKMDVKEIACGLMVWIHSIQNMN
jgi:hypothetical protein